MDNEINLLIIEDNHDQIEAYLDNISLYNEKNTEQIIPKPVNNYEDGIKSLENPNYDAAIIDLRLFPGDTKATGNHIVKEIRNNLRIPIFIISGFPEDLDKNEWKDNPFIKIYKKDDDYQIIFAEIANIYKTGITNILGKKGHIERYLNDIFWNHLSSTISYWIEETGEIRDVEKILLRYTLTHLQEHLDLSEDLDVFDNYYPIEMYVTPPIKKNHFTGDIIQNKEDKIFWIILNPSCDMAQGKAKSITVAQIEDVNNEYASQLIRGVKKGDEKSLDAKIQLEKLLRNSGSLKYHFLPSYANFPGGFINFQKVNSLKYKDLENEFDRISTISDRFSKDIIARFSHYYSRQGQPDFNIPRILEEFLK